MYASFFRGSVYSGRDVLIPALAMLLILLTTPVAAAQTIEQDELRYTQQLLGQLAANAAHAAAVADERQRQVEALKAYWKAWCGDHPGCEIKPEK